MKLSKKIGLIADAGIGYRTEAVPRKDLYDWETAAANLERDQRAAWRSFYVACGVVGLCVVGLLSQHYGWMFGHQPLCGTQSPPPPAVVRSTEVYEL
jgi:hypothetical protein